MNSLEIKTDSTLKTVLIAALIAIIMIFSLSLCSFYWADDYGFMSDLTKSGVFQSCYNGYFNWDGRFLSLGSFIQCFSLVYLDVRFIVFNYTLCVFMSGIFMFYTIQNELKLDLKSKQIHLLMILIFPISLWLGSLIHACETIYWATGGAYSVDLLLGSFWVYLFLKMQTKPLSSIQKALFLLFSFAVGGLTQNLSMPFITLIVLQLLSDFLSKNKLLFNAVALFFVTAGLVFIMAAPGNWLRLKDENTSAFDNLNVLILLKNYFFILFKFGTRSAFAIIAAFILSISIARLFNYKINLLKLIHFQIPKSKQQFLEFIDTYKWFIVASSSALPFIAIPAFSGRRTIIYFGYFIMIFIITYCLKIFKKSEDEIKTGNYYGFIFLILICFTVVIYSGIKGATLKTAMNNRENILKTSRGKTVYLPIIKPELSSICFQFADYPYTADYVKTSQETYFGVKIILVDKTIKQ